MAKNNPFEDKNPEWKQIRIFVFAALGILSFFILVALLLGSFYTIDAGQVGVLLSFGKADPIAKGEGLHFKMPIFQRVVKFDAKTLKIEEDAGAASADLQIVSSKIAVNFHIIPERAPEIYTELGIGYVDSIIRPALQESVKAATAKFSAEELIKEREVIKAQILAALKERVISRNIVVEDIAITNFDFSSSFNDAIEAKVTAEQQAFKAQNDLTRITIEAQQKVEQAKGDAESTRLRADAEAYALAVVREQLEQSADLVQYKAVEKWNGHMPLMTGGALPFIDVERIANADNG